jgi:hypothetical protein
VAGHRRYIFFFFFFFFFFSFSSRPLLRTLFGEFLPRFTSGLAALFIAGSLHNAPSPASFYRRTSAVSKKRRGTYGCFTLHAPCYIMSRRVQACVETGRAGRRIGRIGHRCLFDIDKRDFRVSRATSAIRLCDLASVRGFGMQEFCWAGRSRDRGSPGESDMGGGSLFSHSLFPASQSRESQSARAESTICFLFPGARIIYESFMIQLEIERPGSNGNVFLCSRFRVSFQICMISREIYSSLRSRDILRCRGSNGLFSIIPAAISIYTR